jgi:hypothetical protein
MNPVKNSKSGLLALLAAGGLLAWRNRDKIQSWMNDQRSRLNDQFGSAQPATGETRRIGQPEYPSMNDIARTQNDPLNRDM